MNPHQQFCPNTDCPARGKVGAGNIVSHSQRDKRLIGTLVAQIRTVALCRVLLLAVDGLVSYVDAFHKAFRTPLPTGKRGRRRLIPWHGVNIVQVVKRRTAKELTFERRIVQGDELTVATCLNTSQGGGQINIAFIERLNATFRQCLACLGRRSRSLARQTRTLHAGMFLVGCVYNFCHDHASLRLPLWISERRCHWVQRTPAMAAGLTDHRWSVLELLTFKVPPPPFVPPKRRGRPPKRIFQEGPRYLVELPSVRPRKFPKIDDEPNPIAQIFRNQCGGPLAFVHMKYVYFPKHFRNRT